jgi:ATP-dependent protease HslVU (ClpYQ) peptidase subunit
MNTTMDEELRQVQKEIAATKADLTKAKRERKEDLVLMYGNMLVVLNQKELLLLSAGEIYCDEGVCDIVWFLTLLFSVSNCM